MYGDTGHIRTLAQQVTEQAADIRSDADGLMKAAELVVWDGQAATAMRERMAARAVGLRTTADRHEDAAEALRHHADEVDHLKGLIADIAGKVAGLVEGAKSRLASIAAQAMDLLDKVLPDPIDEMLARFSPPPQGHKDWLDVPDQLPGVFR